MRFFTARTIGRIVLATVAGAGFALGAVSPASADDPIPTPDVPVVVASPKGEHTDNWPWG